MFFKSIRLTPIHRIRVCSNHAFHKRRKKWRTTILSLDIYYTGRCCIDRVGSATEQTNLDMATITDLFWEVFSGVVNDKTKVSNITVDPYDLVTNITVTTSPRLSLTAAGMQFCWSWVRKNILADQRPVVSTQQ